MLTERSSYFFIRQGKPRSHSDTLMIVIVTVSIKRSCVAMGHIGYICVQAVSDVGNGNRLKS
jgi:hypothetical protein